MGLELLGAAAATCDMRMTNEPLIASLQRRKKRWIRGASSSI